MIFLLESRSIEFFYIIFISEWIALADLVLLSCKNLASFKKMPVELQGIYCTEFSKIFVFDI